MDESESKNERPKEGRRFSQEQYEMLKRCSDKKDITEWNKWREKYPDEDVELESGQFYKEHREDKALVLIKREFPTLSYDNGEITRIEGMNLQNANLNGAYLSSAGFIDAKLQVSMFDGADLREAKFAGAYLEGSTFAEARLQSTCFAMARVDEKASFWNCEVDRYVGPSRGTNFDGVPLDVVRIDTATKQLLEYNIRRMNWEEWYKKGYWWQQILKRLLIWPFWLISDYGLRTWRVIATFFGLTIAFAVVYWLCPTSVMVNQVVGDIRGLWHALYFSVVTMTTLGFGDIAANPDSWGWQTLLMLQVILGYVLLGALVTRFAVLFTAGGPAGEFADQKKNRNKTTEKIKN